MPKRAPATSRRKTRGPGTGSRQYAQQLFKGWARSQPHSSFPDRTVVSLDYWSTNRVNPGVVTYADTVFGLNNAFDPEFTGTGHQPRDFDQWAAIYAKYRVIKTLVEVDVRQRAAHGITVTLVPSNSSTALVLTDYPQELQRAVMLGITGSAQPVCHWRGVIDAKAILGMTTEEFRGDDATAALVTAGPSQAIFLHVFAAQLDGVTVADFEFAIRMRMEIEFYDRKVLSPSALAAMFSKLPVPAAPTDDEEEVVVVRRGGAAAAALAAIRK